MRVKAFILLVCFSVYFTETIAAANYNNTKAEKSSCCKMKAKQCAPLNCPQKPKDCSDKCFNCPLFYSSILPGIISISVTSFLIEKKFNLLPVEKLYSYHIDIWKPPNSL